LGSPIEIAIFAIVIFLGIGLHEYAHCKVAELMGDPTPREMGRVTLNLFKHFDPMGTVMIVITAIAGIGIGWGKPAPVNPSRMKNPRWGFFASVLAGPACNILQATFYAIILRILVFMGLTQNIVFAFVFLGAALNIRLAIFNLIPLGPLDGQWLLGLLMPKPTMAKWFQFNRQYGGFMLMGLILFSQFSGQAGGNSPPSLIQGPPVEFVFTLLTGQRY